MSDSEGHRDESAGEGRLAAVGFFAKRFFRPHLRAFAIGAPVILLFDYLVSDGWWFFWPLLVWGLIFGLHYLYAATLSVADDWVQRRADQVADKAYDFGHIEDIRERYESVKAPRRDDEKSQG